MRQLVSYMFTSLDGFIADDDGGLEWVPINDELMRFANEYFSAADGIVFGRHVYDIDHVAVLVAAVVLGSGVPLFGDTAMPRRLRLEASSASGGGVVMLDYDTRGIDENQVDE